MPMKDPYALRVLKAWRHDDITNWFIIDFSIFYPAHSLCAHFWGTVWVNSQSPINVKLTPNEDRYKKYFLMWWHHHDIITWFLMHFWIFKFPHRLYTRISRCNFFGQQTSIGLKVMLSTDGLAKVQQKKWRHDDVIMWIIFEFKIFVFFHRVCTHILNSYINKTARSIGLKPSMYSQRDGL
jgi:hypothetical protein